MEKRTKKISINLTEEQYDIIVWLATHERRSIGETAALIIIDNSQALFNQLQTKPKWGKPNYSAIRMWGDDL